MENSTSRFRKWFDLILTMVDGKPHTAADLTRVIGTTPRNFYYVLQVLRKMGFDIVHENHCYHIDPRSPFLSGLVQMVNLSEDEAAYIYSLLVEEPEDSVIVGTIKRKLARYYDLRQYTDAKMLQQQFANVEVLSQAIAQRHVAILHDYSSPHSHTLSDRVVEPFVFLGNKMDVRAYELKSKQNKTFKIARIGWVEMVDSPWFNEPAHRDVFTDMFMFSGEERHHVRLRLSQLAQHLMREEYPHSAPFLRRDDAAHWLLETDVTSYVGLSRFVLGLYEDVEVLEDEGLKAYIQDKIERMPRRR